MPSSQLWSLATSFPSSPLNILWGSAGKGVWASSQLLSLAHSTWHRVGPHKCTCWMNETGKPLQNTLNNFRVFPYHFSDLDTHPITSQNNSIPKSELHNNPNTYNLDTVRRRAWTMMAGSSFQSYTWGSIEDTSCCVSVQQMYTITNLAFHVSSLKCFMLHFNWLYQVVISLSLNTM